MRLFWGKLGRSLPRAFMATVLAVGVWMSSTGYLAGPANWLVEQTRDAGIVLNKLTINGAEKTPKNAILAALDVDTGMPMLAMDLDQMRLKIEAMPWVKSARISRRLNGELVIDLVERQPFALWQSKGALSLVDPDGEVITQHGLKAYEALILIVGSDALTATAELENILNQAPHLRSQVRSAIYVSQRRWDIEFKNGIRVKLPAVGEVYGGVKAWQKFSRLEEKYQLLAREINVVDLRVKGRLVVGVTESGRKKMRGQEWST